MVAHSASSKVDPTYQLLRYCIVIAHAQYSYLNTFYVFMYFSCGLTVNHRCLDTGASMRLLDCSYFSIIKILYSRIQPSLASCSKLYFYKCYVRNLRVFIRNRYRLVPNQITAFVTTMIIRHCFGGFYGI